MKTATVSQKGWIVIPREIRERYGIHPGTKVAVIEYGGTLSLVPLPADPIESARGFLTPGPSLSQELLAEHRRERQREDREAA